MLVESVERSLVHHTIFTLSYKIKNYDWKHENSVLCVICNNVYTYSFKSNSVFSLSFYLSISELRQKQTIQTYCFTSYDKCTDCKSLWIKASAKCPKCKCKCKRESLSVSRSVSLSVSFSCPLHPVLLPHQRCCCQDTVLTALPLADR